jgi:hypothetical protein
MDDELELIDDELYDKDEQDTLDELLLEDKLKLTDELLLEIQLTPSEVRTRKSLK